MLKLMGSGTGIRYDVIEIPGECTVAELKTILDQYEPKATICFNVVLSSENAISKDRIKVPIITSSGRGQLYEELVERWRMGAKT